MPRLASIAGTAVGLLTLAWPGLALAQGLASGAAQAVAGDLPSGVGGCNGIACALSIVEFAISRFQLLVVAAGTFSLVRNAFTLLNTSAEDDQARSKKAIAVTLAAVMLAYLAPVMLQAFYTAGGEEGILASAEGVTAGSQIVTEEILGVARWALTSFAVICILAIIITGIRALTSTDDGGGRLKSAVISIIAGGLLIITGEAIKAALGVTDFGVPTGGPPDPIIARGVQIVAGILGIILLVALAVIIYAAIMMILSAGDEDQYGKAKSLILRAGTGLIIIFLSYMLVNFILELIGG